MLCWGARKQVAMGGQRQAKETQFISHLLPLGWCVTCFSITLNPGSVKGCEGRFGRRNKSLQAASGIIALGSILDVELFVRDLSLTLVNDCGLRRIAKVFPSRFDEFGIS